MVPTTNSNQPTLSARRWLPRVDMITVVSGFGLGVSGSSYRYDRSGGKY